MKVMDLRLARVTPWPLGRLVRISILALGGLGALGTYGPGLAGLAAAEGEPFEALREGRVQTSVPLGSIAEGALAGAGVVRVLAPGRSTSEVGPDGRFRLEGLPIEVPVRALLIPGGVSWGQGAERAALATPPRTLDGSNAFSASADISGPGAPPVPVFALELLGSGGSRTAVFSMIGEKQWASARGRTATGDLLESADILGGLAHRLESSNEAVASVSADGEITAKGPGSAWIRLGGDGEWAQLLVLVDLSLDSDSDGMPDSFEATYALNPRDPADRTLDADGDGLTNAEEYLYGTDPRNADTDRDFLSDAAEVVVWGTDPIQGDSDGDFTLDGSEVEAGTDPLDPNEKPGTIASPGFKQVRTFSPSAIRMAATANDLQYILTTDNRLNIYRVTGSTYIIIFRGSNFFSGDLRDIHADGATAYVAAASTGLHVVDVSNPSLPSLKSTIAGLGSVTGVFARKGTVYVAGDLGLWILKQEAGGNVDLVGAISVPSFSRFAVSEPIAYLGIPGSNRLISVDVSDPATPRELQRFAMPASAARFRALEAVGQCVYVAHGDGGLLAVSAHDPTNLEIIDSSSGEFPGASFDALARVGNRLLAHTPTRNTAAQIYRLRDDGAMEHQGEVAANTNGAIQLVGAQNYLVSLSSGAFAVSEILPFGDRQASPPSGQLLREGDQGPAAPGQRLRFLAYARDDIYLETVEFYVQGSLVLRDSVPPFRYDLQVGASPAPPYVLAVEAVGVDLNGNETVLGLVPVCVDTDLDGDGIPDSQDPDRDGDSVPDLEEEYPGSDGFVSDPSLLDTDGDGLADGEEYWGGTGGYVTNGGSCDTDGDGLTDSEEITIVGTNPTLADTDTDGVDDGAEDGDSDGLNNLDEVALGTDPRKSDTDSDGVPDGLERALALDPLRADTDGDGIRDGDEDSDLDGISNLREIALGLSPLKADTDGDGFDDPTEIDLGTDPATPSDFSKLAISLRSKTVVLRGAVTVGSLELRGAVLTVPEATVDEISPLQLTVLSALRVDASSRIDATGRGYLGGRSGTNSGWKGLGPSGPSVGEMTGGSHGGIGGHPDYLSRSDSSPVHGSVRRPASAGGGGSSSQAGGGRGGNGGGVVAIRAATIQLDGLIAASGEASPELSGAGGGAGGSVWIECAQILGTGSVRADGGSASSSGGPRPGGGGGGRIAIYLDEAPRPDLALVTARGGSSLPGPDSPGTSGGAGTVYLLEAESGTGGEQGGEPGSLPGELLVENGGRAQDEPATVLPDAGEGTIAEMGDDFFVRLEGDLPDDVIGLEIDPDADDGTIEAFEILAIAGNRVATAPGLLSHTRPGARYRGIWRLDRLVVRSSGALRADTLLVLSSAAAALEIAGGGELRVADLVFTGQSELRLEDATLTARSIEPPGGTFASLALIGSTLRVDGGLEAGAFDLESSGLVASGPVVAGSMALRASAASVPEPTAERAHVLEIQVRDTLTVDAASRIDLDGKGYVGAGRGGNTARVGQTADHALLSVGGRTGGGHGAIGGVQGLGPGLGTIAAPVYDDCTDPRRPGGGGSGKLNATDLGYNGGGLARIVAGELFLDGRISASGDGRQRAGVTDTGGGGGGGGLAVHVGVLRGSGEIAADGGSGDGTIGVGCGGGGRIAIRYTDRSGWQGSVHAFGGVTVPPMAKPEAVGGAGTIFWKSSLQSYGDLVVDNADRLQATGRTLLRPVGTGTIASLSANALKGSASFPTSDTGLQGLWVVVKGVTASPFSIVSNTADEILTDPQGGDMTAIGAVGDSYQGAMVLDNLTVIRRGALVTGGDLIIISKGGTVTLSPGGSIVGPPVVRW